MSPSCLLLTNAHLIDPASGREGPGAVLVRDRSIADVHWGTPAVLPEGAEVIATVRDGRLILGSAGGYLLGFMLAAAASGRLAELGWDRKVGRALVTMTVGSLLIYLVGVPWLMAAEDLAVGEAIRLGLLPYLLGDLVKIVLAAAILPAAWWVVGRRPVAS